jgi:hypothetical protein
MSCEEMQSSKLEDTMRLLSAKRHRLALRKKQLALLIYELDF